MDGLTLSTQRLVHLDLKGAPPKPSYFEKFFPLIKDTGATGILLEWEDTFPYTKDLQPIGGLSNSAQVSGSPYSLEEAHQIVDMATDCGLTIVPLVQTFGHMEFVLKHDQWRSLREVETYPSSMCPSNSEAMVLVRSLLKQIILFHSEAQYVHIGADEVWHMGLCPSCSKRSLNSKYGKASIYLEHVTEVAQYIKETFPNLKVIIWDDMLRSIDLRTLQDFFSNSQVEPMVWHYNSGDTFHLGAPLWDKYSSVFSNIWVASAFKGASSSCQVVPPTKHHVSNQEAWLSELSSNVGKIINFRGVAFTGWSRYDHYATLCELLPSGVPSLCLCLKTWLNGGFDQDLHNSVGRLLGYDENSPTDFGTPIKVPDLPNLTFPGWQISLGLEWYVQCKLKYRNITQSDQIQSWFNPWQVTNNYTNPMQVDTILPVVTECLNDVLSLESYLKLHLDQVFYAHTVEELLGTLIHPVKEHLKQIQSDCETQLSLGCRARGQKRLNL